MNTGIADDRNKLTKRLHLERTVIYIIDCRIRAFGERSVAGSNEKSKEEYFWGLIEAMADDNGRLLRTIMAHDYEDPETMEQSLIVGGR